MAGSQSKDRQSDGRQTDLVSVSVGSQLINSTLGREYKDVQLFQSTERA